MDVPAEVISPGERDDISQIAREQVQRGSRTIVAGGGDGTVNAIAAVLAESDTALGVLPLGTLNHLSKDLGIPQNLSDAMRVLAGGESQRIDVGEVNGRIFLNNASLGIYPRIVEQRERDQQQHRLPKLLALMKATFNAIRRLVLHRVRIVFNGREIQRRSPFVMVGNNEYSLEGIDRGTRRSLTAGRLSLLVATPRNRWDIVRLGFRAVFGRLRKDRDFEVFTAREFDVHVRGKPVRIALDGEVVRLQSPLRFRIRALSLRVVRPSLNAPSNGARS